MTPTSAKRTGSPSTIITNCLPRRVADVSSVVAAPLKTFLQLTTIIRVARFVDYSARHVTRRWAGSGTVPTDSIRRQAISEIHRHEAYWGAPYTRHEATPE